MLCLHSIRNTEKTVHVVTVVRVKSHARFAGNWLGVLGCVSTGAQRGWAVQGVVVTDQALGWVSMWLLSGCPVFVPYGWQVAKSFWCAAATSQVWPLFNGASLWVAASICSRERHMQVRGFIWCMWQLYLPVVVTWSRLLVWFSCVGLSVVTMGAQS